MKLTILVPSEEYKLFAGARIRYNRVIPELARRGIDARIEAIGEFDPAADFDAILLSKCHDAQSVIAAAAASQSGKLVGVDLFDDYFSDRTDTRLVRYRSWLTQLVDVCDFALCSTAAMERVIGQYRETLPTHIMNDPAPGVDQNALSALLAGKLSKAHDEGRIRVAWFGVGDNQYFRVGLSDLASYSSALADLRKSGMAIELTVLTNRRSLTAEGLALIGQLPVEATVREWSEDEEREVLRDSLVAFLPVNAQGFSSAKSLNRAFTALAAGCQVLSVGYPLYAALEPLIYDDAGALISDIQNGSLRFSEATMDRYQALVDALGSPQTEAERLARFFAGLSKPSIPDPRPVSLIHGHSTRAEAHRLVRSIDGLSVASPYCSEGFDFDVVFRADGSGELQMLVSRNASGRLLPDVRRRLSGSERVGRQLYHYLDGKPRRRGKAALAPWHTEPVPFQIATYSRAMGLIGRRMDEAFGPCRQILSETSLLPFPAVPWAA